MSTSRHRRRPTLTRRSVGGGAALGVLLLSALTLAGSLWSPSTPPAPEPVLTREPGTLSASQPELEQAVLKPADLSGAYVSVPKATVRRLPTVERCAKLLDPSSLVQEASSGVAGGAESIGQATSRLQGPTQLLQLLTSFSGDGATETMRQLKQIGQQCRDFKATLDDGTPVRVRVEQKPVTGPDLYLLKLTLTGDGHTTAGYISLRRAGQILSVLRQLGSDDAIDPLKLVDLTLNRLTQGR